jgi:nitrogen regulatory protein P-II 1
MPEMVIMVLDDPTKTDVLLRAWLDLGVTGTTIFNSTGLARELCEFGARDDLSLMPSLTQLLQCREEAHRTLLAIVPENFDLDRLAEVSQSIVGSFDEPDTGILFSIPVGRVWGLRRG